MRLTQLLASLLSLLFLACGPGPDETDASVTMDDFGELHDELTGGAYATRGQFPSTLFFTNLPFFKGYCTGAKVGPRHILTAGHCVYSFSRKAYYLRPGDAIAVTNNVSVDRTGTIGPTFKVKRVTAHPKWVQYGNAYSEPVAADVAVIELETSLSAFTQASVYTGKVAPGTYVYMQGYGCENGLKGGSDSVAKLKYRYTRTATTSSAFSGVTPHTNQAAHGSLDDTYFFTLGKGASGSEASLCPGDSGGPAYRKIGTQYYVVGVNAYYSFKDGGNISANNWLTRLDSASDNKHDTDGFLRQQGITLSN